MCLKIDLTQTHDVLGAFEMTDFSEIKKNYTDAGTRYAFKVLEGEVVAGYQIKLAALRHLRDLQRQGDDDFPYVYSIKEVEKILKFASICPEVQKMKPVVLMDWQEFILAMLNGWVRTNGSIRFSKNIISIARAQGKTFLMAIMMCYKYLVGSIGLANQDYLVASHNFTQTQKIFGYIKKMIEFITRNKPFKNYAREAGISIQYDKIIMRKSNNVLRAISFESGKFDSFHFNLALLDETGELKTTEGISKISSGQIDIPDSQMVQISTSYPDPNVPFHKSQKILQQIMEQDFDRQGDEQLCLVWAQDDLSETYEPETWPKSNPKLYMAENYDEAIQGLVSERDSLALDGDLVDFQNKNLNLWLQQSVKSYLKLADVEKAIVPEFNIRGREVYIGLDASMFSDNTAIGFVYPYLNDDGEQRFHIEQYSFIPFENAGSIEAKEKQDGINYRQLAEKGFCSITSNEFGIINLEEVYQWLVNFVEDNELKVLFFGYDAFGVSKLTKTLDMNMPYWNLMAIRQISSYMTQATKFMQAGFIEGTIDRLDDEIMQKALINAQLKEDKAGVIVDKAKSTLKIDVVDAILDAMYQAMYHFEGFSDVNDASKQVSRMTQEQVKDWLLSQESGLLDDY